ncbi:HNH endonuclease signature motif containing protein [Jiangella anatolica]|uniref:HNH nuclease domain-containing protein n=1 Tax=Jiangella anatolica TaxID=2670374 RepID=A0A2W2CC49_9ACTN|nr:HNH endonuclease signature motif containing protein [Jiangella anatolica]PZF85857.1 hypothetical protein C1I92_02955 [Jiangella anatolica]
MFEEAPLTATSSQGSGLAAGQYVALPADVERMPTGPELAAALAAFDPEADTAEAYDLVEAAAAWARLAAWVAGNEARVLAALASRAEMRPDFSGYRSVSPVTNTAVEVAGRCQVTTRQAENHVGHSLQLVNDFPATQAALTAGLIDLRRARVLTDELGAQEPDVRARVEAAVLPKAPAMDAVALRKLVKRVLHELAPVETAERHRLAREGRYVAVTPASDGMAFLEALLPAEDATALNTVLKVAAADAKRADTAAGRPVRGYDQRRADALAELGWAALAACAGMERRPTGREAAAEASTGDQPPADTRTSTGHRTDAHTPTPTGHRPRRPVSVHVTVPFTALAGLTDEPGELRGYGPISAPVARELAAAGVWTWLRTDPATGQVLDAGRRTYRPTTALAEFIVARDRTCRAPGCHQPAANSDIDHVIPFAAGGTTVRANCQALCETHHLLKHRGHWTVRRGPGGITRWRGPTGHHYTKPPEAVGAPLADALPP